jgi:hypothetical protein
MVAVELDVFPYRRQPHVQDFLEQSRALLTEA